MSDELTFYAFAGPFTSDIDAPEIVEGLRTEILNVSDILSGLAYHEAFSAEYGVEVPKDRPKVDNVRQAAELTAGVPTRSRCGFCPAPDERFGAGRFLDHWWVERWDRVLTRWVRLDTAIDEQLATALQLDFDPRDIPSGVYLSGAEAWQRCKSGVADPALFGVPGIWGVGMVRGNVVRDLAALNKVELLPWDPWGFVDESPIGEGTHDTLIDEVAQAVASNDWPQFRALYQGKHILQPSVLS